MSPLAFYRQMINSGMDEAAAYKLAEQFEADETAKAEARYEALLSRLAQPTDKAAEKRREWDRQRKADQLAAKKSGGNRVESAGPQVEKVEIHPTKDAPAPTYTRGEDNLSRLVDPCPAVAVVAEAREPGFDWPPGKAAEHARLLVEMVRSPKLDPAKQLGLVTTTGRLDAWRREGASWEHDVVPIVSSGVARKTGPPINSWKFFDPAIAQSIADNRRALEIPQADSRRHDRPNPRSSKFADKQANMERALRGAEMALAERRF